MTELYRWTLERFDSAEPGTTTLIAQVTGEAFMVGAGIKAMGGELANRLNATLTAAGFPPVPEPAANGAGRRRGRPPKNPSTPAVVEPDPPQTVLPSTDPFARVHAEPTQGGPIEPM